MDTDFTIKIGDENIPEQEFNGKIYRLYPGERYFSRGIKRMHTAVWEHFNGKIPKTHEMHHKNENTWDNRICNLEIKDKVIHQREHGRKRYLKNKDWFAKFHSAGIEAAKLWHASPDGIKWHRENGKRMWINREHKTLVCQVCGKEYQTRHAGVSKYCHPNCKAKALRKRRKEERLRSSH